MAVHAVIWLRSYLNKGKEKESFIFRFSVLPACLQDKLRRKLGNYLPPSSRPPANRRITMPRPVPSNCNRHVPFNKDIVQGHKGRGFNSLFQGYIAK